jgi:VanZ family protein
VEIPENVVGGRRSGFVWYWLPVGLYASLIFYLSSLSHPEQFVPNLFLLKLGDKVLHAIEYAGLGFLCYRAFRHAAGTLGRSYAVLLAVGAATLYGATDEWHQAYVPFRESDRWDLATDWLGAMAGALTWAWTEERRSLPTGSNQSAGPARHTTPDR